MGSKIRSIRARIILVLVLIFLSTITLNTGVSYFRASELLRSSVFSRLIGEADLYAREIRQWIQEEEASLNLWCKILGTWLEKHPESVEMYWAMFQKEILDDPQHQEISFIHPFSGRVILGSNPEYRPYRQNSPAFHLAQRESFVSGIHISPQTLTPAITLAAPVVAGSQSQGILVLDLNLSGLKRTFEQQTKEGRDGAVYLVDSINGFLTGSGVPPQDLNRGLHSDGITEAIHGNSGDGVYLNYRGTPVAGVYRWLPELETALINEVPLDSAFKPALDLGWDLFRLWIVIAIGAAIWLAYYTSQFTRPILGLQTAAKLVARGDWTVIAPVTTEDEIGELARNFNAMTRELGRLYQELEDRVKERTSELQDALSDLKKAQSNLVNSEKMALLGQLTAGVAHELNSPLSALISASRSLEQDFSQSEHSELENPLSPSPEERKLKQLFDKALIDPKDPRTSLQEAQVMQELIPSLEPYLGETAPWAAKGLVRLGLEKASASLGPALKAPHGFDILRRALNRLDMKLNLRVIQTAASRASVVVQALQYYSHPNQGEMTPVNLYDNLELALTLHQTHFKNQVVLVKNFEPGLSPIMAYADQIGQVWTNLFQNALQAMEYHGRLEVGLRTVRGGVEVSVTDSGPGIPPQNLETIFDPFFTTKPWGTGSGLGLDIVKKTVESHAGHVTVESTLGKGACFRVFLPWTKG